MTANGMFTLETRIWLGTPLDVVFPFFADARNLERLTPPWLKFEVITPEPIAMQAGTLIDYRLRLRGVPLRWRSEITLWDPPHRFVDEQRRGPYRAWIHEHRFTSVKGGTEVVDLVRYAVPGGRLVNLLFVARDVRRIFDYRSVALRRIFPGPTSETPR